MIAVPPLVLDFRGRPYRGTDTTKWQRYKHFVPSGGFENLITQPQEAQKDFENSVKFSSNANSMIRAIVMKI